MHFGHLFTHPVVVVCSFFLCDDAVTLQWNPEEGRGNC